MPVKTRLLALSATALLGACIEPVAPTAESLEASTEQALTPTFNFDGCPTASADVIRHVGTGYDTPPEALPATFASGNGGYYYASDDLCFGWVVDTKLAQASPWVVLSADAYDLPSSSAAGGTVPVVQEDCLKYYRNVRFYHRKGDSGAFTLLASSVFKGTWNSTTRVCSIGFSSGNTAELLAKPTAGAGWDYYRTSVYVRLRGSGQQAEVTLSPYIEPPR